jgi:hypothetical protein
MIDLVDYKITRREKNKKKKKWLASGDLFCELHVLIG